VGAATRRSEMRAPVEPQAAEAPEDIEVRRPA
jgi:hypothetical protein